MIKYLFLLLSVSSLFSASQPFAPIVDPNTLYILAPTNFMASNIVAGTNMVVERLTGGVIKISGNSGITNGLASTNYVNTLISTHNYIPTGYTRLIFEGDSLTSGSGGSPYALTLTNSYATNLLFVYGTNAAIAGDTISNMVITYTNEIRPFKPANGTNAILFINGGINDIGAMSYGTVFNNLSNFWRIARLDGYTIVAHTLSDSDAFDTTAVKFGRKQLNELIRANSSLYDYLCDWGLKLPRSVNTNWYSDVTHFNALGYSKIAELEWDALSGGSKSFRDIFDELDSGSMTLHSGLRFTNSGGGSIKIQAKSGDYAIQMMNNLSQLLFFLENDTGVTYFNGRMYIPQLGIGTLSPGTQLEVVGGIIASSTATITNGLITLGSSSIPTNTANYFTSSNTTNQFTTGVLYTNVGQRSLLVGSAVLNGNVSGSANITLLYTNSAVGYSLPMQTGAGLATTDIFPFCVPLSSNSTFNFVSTMGTGATGSLTNVINWRQ